MVQLTQPITGKTKLLGVMGHPISHSLSPVMHNAAIAHLGLDYIYIPLAVHPTDLTTALAGFAAIGGLGGNITIPHKQTILPLLAEVSDTAQAIGAVNTIWRTEAGWAGTNTDVTGFLAPLLNRAIDWPSLRVVILGHGGAARAVVAGCAMQGCAAIQVVGRQPESLHRFANSWPHAPWPLPLSVHPWADLEPLLPQANLLVNTTPVGMSPQVEASPVTPTQLALLPAHAISYDLIYTPSPTTFLRLAAERGLTTIDGTDMLVYQGAAALEQWLNCPAPIAVMQAALHQHLAAM